MKYAALISFTESEKSGRYFNYRNYEHIYVTCESDERPNQIYVPCVYKFKRSFNVEVAIIQKTKFATEEQLLKKLEIEKKKKEIAHKKFLRAWKKAEKERIAKEKELFKRLKEELNLSEKELKSRWEERYFYLKSYDYEIIKEVMSWEVYSKSPYSHSFYNSKDISWGYKPENSLRLSDHWNFRSDGEVHCELAETSEYICHELKLCQYRDGKYHIIREFN